MESSLNDCLMLDELREEEVILINMIAGFSATEMQRLMRLAHDKLFSPHQEGCAPVHH